MKWTRPTSPIAFDLLAYGIVLLLILAAALVRVAAQQTPQFQRGEMVRVAAPINPSDPPASTIVLTIVGMPGDRLRADQQTSTMFVNGGPVTRFTPSVFVNDRPITGFTPDFVARVAAQPNQLPTVVPQESLLRHG